MPYHFRNLVFEGGGVKGIAYVGAMQVLEEKGVLSSIKRVGGTSVGAINAALVALGFTDEEQRKVLWDLDFKNFLDASWFIPNISRVLTRYGWYKGDFFREWMGNLVKEKMGAADATFKDLKEKNKLELYVYGTNLSTRFSEVFSTERTPDMPITEAVRTSMSLPLFFTAVRNARNDVLVDGGVLVNYPVKLFDREKYLEERELATDKAKAKYAIENKEFLAAHPDRSAYVYNKETLGFRLDSRQEIAAFRYDEPQVYKIDGLVDYIGALVKTILDSQSNTHIEDDDWQRTIYIDTKGVSTTDFSLGDDKKRDLEQSGKDGATNYFKWYDDPKNSPANRP
jgi:NTE family protein